MIIVPKYKDIYVSEPIVAPAFGIGGEFRIKRYNSMGQLNYDSGWHKNLIVNNGLVICTSGSNWNNFFYIGSNATAAVVTDTTLGTFLAASAVVQGGDVVVHGIAPDYEFSATRTRRFNAKV